MRRRWSPAAAAAAASPVLLVVAAVALAAAAARVAAAADADDGCPAHPLQYVAYALGADERIAVDGRLDDPAWQRVAWSSSFVDISGPPPVAPAPYFDTRVKVRWDDTFVYVGARLEERAVWANQTAHDSVVFDDNDFEAFFDPDGSTHHYKEFEINALGTVWDLEMNKPYVDGGAANDSWDVFGHGLQTGIRVAGPINDPSAGPDQYWTVELALPHAAYVQQCFAAHSPPRDGEYWRMNFMRVEYRVTVVGNRYVKVPDGRSNWSWQPQGAVNMHLPDRWGYLQFSTAAVNASRPVPDPQWPQRAALAQLYEAEHAYAQANGGGSGGSSGPFTADLTRLAPYGLPAWVTDGSCGTALPNVTLSDGGAWFQAAVLSAAQPDLAVGNIQTDRLLWFGAVPPPDSTA